MKIAIIQFPGSNCDTESLRSIRQAGMEAQEFLWNNNPEDLKNFDGYFIVGGFSYEDRSRAGIISALDPLIPYLKTESEKGKPILGICNGAQILVETGLVPGLKDYKTGMALAVNKRIKNERILGTGFYNTWINMKLSAPSSTCAFTKNLKEGEFINIPIAHGEGRFVIPEKLLEEMKANNLTVFRYCDENGDIKEEFPTNPNGAIYNLAAVCNTSGNVMAMMPHPERSKNGEAIFTSMRDYIAENKSVDLSLLNYSPTLPEILDYNPEKDSFEMLVELKITDNEAITVENALKNLNINAKISKLTHFEIVCEKNVDKQELKNKIIESGELFNSNKETLSDPNVPNLHTNDTNKANMLIRYRDDFVGKSKKDTLKNRFGTNGIKEIKTGVLWKIEAKDDNIEDTISRIIDTHILFNQYSQVCLNYK